MLENEQFHSEIEAAMAELPLQIHRLEEVEKQVDWHMRDLVAMKSSCESLYQVGVAYVRFNAFLKRMNQLKPTECEGSFALLRIDGARLKELYERRTFNDALDIYTIVKGVKEAFDQEKKYIQPTLEKWKDLRKMYKALEISGDRLEGAGEIETRSHKTMQNMVDKFLRHQREQNPDIEVGDLILLLQEQAERERQGLGLGYYETVQDAHAICEEKNIMVLHEHDERQREYRAKSLEGAADVLETRREIEQALGHNAERVIHLTVDSDEDRKRRGGAMGNYGPVRFGFNIWRIQGATTFTVGDSLNSRSVRDLFLNGIDGTGSMYERKVQSAQNRQIMFEHIPLAKAMMHLSVGQGEKAEPLFYIEAQIDDSERGLFDALLEIAVDKSQVDTVGPEFEARAKEMGIEYRCWNCEESKEV